jgi:hypothetical protein
MDGQKLVPAASAAAEDRRESKKVQVNGEDFYLKTADEATEDRSEAPSEMEDDDKSGQASARVIFGCLFLLR